MDLRVDVDRARAYVLAHGGSRDQARLDGIFGAPRPDRDVVKALESLQNPDGGFPLRQEPGAPSGVDTTCYILAQLKDLPPLAGSPMASRALAFLRRSQNPAGHWEESAAVKERAPRWAAGDPASTAYLTANAAYTLLTMEPDHMDPVARGAAWLRKELEDGAGGQYMLTLALAAAVFYKLGLPEVAAAHESLSGRQMDAGELAWWLSCALEAGVGGRYLLPVARQLADLAALQQPDGSWPAEEGFAVESTLMALRVFRGYGVV